MNAKITGKKQRQTGSQLKVSSNPDVVFLIAFLISKYMDFNYTGGYSIGILLIKVGNGGKYKSN